MFPRTITYDHISSKNILHQLVEKGAEESNPISPDLVKLNIINKIQLDEEIKLSDSLTTESPSVILSNTFNTLSSYKSKIGDKGLDEEKVVTGEGHTTKEGKKFDPMELKRILNRRVFWERSYIYSGGEAEDNTLESFD